MNKRQGFTIVELLIVIVVIAILAAISIVVYAGIQNRAYDSAVQSDLKAVMTKLELLRAGETIYPYATAITDFRASKSAYTIAPTVTNNLISCWSNDRTVFGFVALSKSGKIFYISSNSGGVREYAGVWVSGSMTACTTVIPEAQQNYNGYASTDTTTGPWRAWTGGN